MSSERGSCYVCLQWLIYVCNFSEFYLHLWGYSRRSATSRNWTWSSSFVNFLLIPGTSASPRSALSFTTYSTLTSLLIYSAFRYSLYSFQVSGSADRTLDGLFMCLSGVDDQKHLAAITEDPYIYIYIFRSFENRNFPWSVSASTTIIFFAEEGIVSSNNAKLYQIPKMAREFLYSLFIQSDILRDVELKIPVDWYVSCHYIIQHLQYHFDRHLTVN